LDDAIYLTGNNSKQEMLDGLAEFKATGGILLCTPIFGEGVNMPDVGVIILAGGGKSHIQLLQRIGRGMRTAEGKEEVIIIDFIDDTNKFLFKHSEVRYSLYKQEGFKVSMYEIQ
jgi:superfamily II DNA or RNA helicase